MGILDELLNKINGHANVNQENILQNVGTLAASGYRFIPNPGPQTEAYFSAADILLYGGQAGGGKSQLLLGLGCSEHQKSIIYRREMSQADGLEADGKAIIGRSASYNGQDHEWTWKGGKILKLAGMKEPDDWMKHAGRERDFIGFDEAGEFLEKQIRSLIAWLRGPVGQRCRVVLASNPPRRAEGLWMLKWFAPWLDPNFEPRATPGELRWAILMDNDLRWVEGQGQYEYEGKQYTAMSFTFVPASLKDNPYRNTPEYIARLQSLPEPLRSQLLFGDFGTGMKDLDYQVIPTEWILAAQNRWTKHRPTGMAMSCMALDPAGGGADSEEMVYRYGGWFSEPISETGPQTADGSITAANVVRHRRDQCPVVIDVGGGYGGAAKLRLLDNDIKADPFNGANGSMQKTADGALRFANKRAEIYWRLREALDPGQEGGSVVALYPSAELRADLAAPTWHLVAKGIQLLSKDEIKKKLGRSPGKGDAVAMCYSEGNRAIMRKHMNKSGNQPKVVMGHMEKRR